MSILRAATLRPIRFLSLGFTYKNIILKDYKFISPSRIFYGNTLPQSEYLTSRLPPRTFISPHSVGFSSASKQLKEVPEKPSPSSASKFKWRSFSSYYNEFKTSPGSHLTSFLILHEITAILPLSAIFLFLQYSGLQPFDLKTLSPETFEVAAKPARYVLKMFGQEESSLHIGSSTFVNLVMSYALVKLAGPVRVVLSAALTPWFSRLIIHRIIKLVKNRIKSKNQ